MATVIWSGPAVRHVQRIGEVIAQDSPAVAGKWVRRIMTAPDILETMPLFGPMVEEIGRPEIRELLVKPYRIIYRVRGDVCTVGAVYDGRQDLLSHLDPDELP